MTNYSDNTAHFSVHQRAERLIDDERDASRGEGALTRDDAQWLDEHLAVCEACRAFREERAELFEVMRAAAPLRAPAGFAERVIAAAKSSSEEAPVVELAPRPFTGRLALGSLALAAAAAGLFFFASGAPTSGPAGTTNPVQVSGHAIERAEAPHFLVRAPGVGAAQVRAQIAVIVDRHDGQLTGQGDDVLVRIPRAELIGVMKDLASRGRFKVQKAAGGELDADVESIIIRFELD